MSKFKTVTINKEDDSFYQLPRYFMYEREFAKRRVRIKRALRCACRVGKNIGTWVKFACRALQMHGNKEDKACFEVGKIIAEEMSNIGGQ